MNPSGIFIERPIATTLLMFALLLVGLIAYPLLPVSSLPQVDYPTIQVTTFYPGASPDVMASSITAPLERQFGQMSGLSQMTSTSGSTASVITLQFTLETSLDVCEQEVQAAINAALTYLPNDLPNPPIYNKVNPADAPIMTLALTSKTLALPEVEDFADTRLAQKIAQVSGVGLVSISGGQRPAVRVQVNSDAIASLGLTLENLRSAIAAANVNAAKGGFDGKRLAYTINANDQLFKSIDYKNLIIAYKNSAPVRLMDVATVIDDAENVNQAAWMNLTPAVILNIQRQPGANVIAVVDRIKQIIPILKNTLPKAINVSILTDRTNTIRASVASVELDLLISILLVITVIYLFLRNIPATFIPSVAVPLSLIGTFALMYVLGFSLNNLTLMALTISAGFVIDDAIVMIENISRYLGKEKDALTAAKIGSAQIGFTIMSLTISLIAVLIPLLFMQDVIGRLFREFAVTVSVAILLSAFISLTLTPMLCSRLLKPSEQRHAVFFEKWLEYYRQSLAFILERQTFMLVVAFITLLITGLLFYNIPKGFFPIQDTGIIQGISESAQSISFKEMSRRQEALAKIILSDPAVASLSSFIGIDGINTTLNSGRFQINLQPLEARDVNATQVIARLQEKLAKVVGTTLYMQPAQDLTIDNRVSRTQYQYSIGAPDAEDVAKWTTLFLNKFKQIPELQDVASDQQNKGLQLFVTIDRATASRLGISSQLIDETLYDAFGQRQISIIFTQRNQYHVVLEVLPHLQLDPNALKHIYINSSNNGMVPLAVFTKATPMVGPLVINRQGQFPVAILSFNLTEGGALGDAMKSIDQAKSDLHVPDNIQTQFEGAARIFQSSLSNEGWLMLAAILVVYIVLGVLYESFIHPITILSTLPSACIGALVSLILFGHTLSIIALIGIILLIGIVMKNAIMMIDFALEQERIYKKSPRDAIYEAAILRFRPILMTTLASLFGAVPLAVGGGMGSELRAPLGIAIIGGLMVSQLLTLYTTPVIYLFFDRSARILSMYLFKLQDER